MKFKVIGFVFSFFVLSTQVLADDRNTSNNRGGLGPSVFVQVDSNVSVNGGNDGAVTAVASGGVMPYTYAWSNGATTASVTGLMAGLYSVTLTDNNGRTASASGVVTQPTAVVANITSTTNPSTIGGNDGSATAMASGGTPPYSYLWNTAQTTATATGLAAGTYTGTVTDDDAAAATTRPTLVATFTATETKPYETANT